MNFIIDLIYGTILFCGALPGGVAIVICEDSPSDYRYTQIHLDYHSAYSADLFCGVRRGDKEIQHCDYHSAYECALDNPAQNVACLPVAINPLIWRY